MAVLNNRHSIKRGSQGSKAKHQNERKNARNLGAKA